MLLKQIVLFLAGLCAGGILAAGVFAFLAIIGVFPRVIGKTGTKGHILLYETVIISGGILGNLLDLYEFPVPVAEKAALILGPERGRLIGEILLGAFGVFTGIFVGCLAMSLAETLKAMPVICRRIRLSVGLQYLILSIGLGKLTGSLLFFLTGMGES